MMIMPISSNSGFHGATATKKNNISKQISELEVKNMGWTVLRASMNGTNIITTGVELFNVNVNCI